MIYICAYRDWGIEIYNNVKDNHNQNIILINSKKELTQKSSLFKTEDVLFFLGWSWRIEDEIVNNYRCICLHPSPLPKYRGGSPIQHQIINGEKNSSITFFEMNKKLDAGKILHQREFSLKGELNDIFKRIISLGTTGILTLLYSRIEGIEQDESQATYYKRRKPEESEITIDEIKNKSVEYLHNKIRMLNDPYPNAYIKDKDGNKLYITKTQHND
jgi:methionyl-tRNA formyltransferase